MPCSGGCFFTLAYGYIELMPQANWVIILHFVLLWGSVITSLAAGWRINMPLPVAIPLGVMLWLLGILYNFSVIQRQRRGAATHRTAQARRSYLRIAARTIMNVGVALAFRSWLTLIVAAILIPFYAAAARRRERYLDYMRTGMLSDAFPDRIVKH
jgi:hypothetical protein